MGTLKGQAEKFDLDTAGMRRGLRNVRWFAFAGAWVIAHR
jgi:hypothetical protein